MTTYLGPDGIRETLIIRLHGTGPDGDYRARTNGNYGTDFYADRTITVTGGTVVQPNPENVFDVQNFASPGVQVSWTVQPKEHPLHSPECRH